MSGRLSKFIAFLSVALCVGQAFGGLASHTISFNGILSSDVNPSDTIADIPLSFVDSTSGATITYTLQIGLDWVDASGAQVTGLTGEVFGGTRLGANTVAPLDFQDTGAVEEVFLESGGSAFERLTFTVSDVTSSIGTAAFVDFGNITGTDLANAAVAGSDILTTTGTSDGPFRLSSVEANFDMQPDGAVPEPATWMMFAVLGGLVTTRVYQQTRSK